MFCKSIWNLIISYWFLQKSGIFKLFMGEMKNRRKLDCNSNKIRYKIAKNRPIFKMSRFLKFGRNGQWGIFCGSGFSASEFWKWTLFDENIALNLFKKNHNWNAHFYNVYVLSTRRYVFNFKKNFYLCKQILSRDTVLCDQSLAEYI